jgi:hypothetical protein
MFAINGYNVVAMIPIFRAGRIDAYLITATGKDNQSVTAFINKPDDTSWYWAHYFMGDIYGTDHLTVALKEMYVRASMHIIDWKQLEEEVKSISVI